MSPEIKQFETLTDDEWRTLYGWGDDIFGANAFNLRWRPKELHFLLFDDEKPVSHVGVLKHTVVAGENPVTVGGVGGVVTVPEAQGKGFAALLMRRVADFFEHEWKTDTGLLFCLPRMISYYESLGWQTIEEAVLIEQPGGTTASPMSVMVLPFGDKTWPRGTVELHSFPW